MAAYSAASIRYPSRFTVSLKPDTSVPQFTLTDVCFAFSRRILTEVLTQ